MKLADVEQFLASCKSPDVVAAVATMATSRLLELNVSKGGPSGQGVAGVGTSGVYEPHPADPEARPKTTSMTRKKR